MIFSALIMQSPIIAHAAGTPLAISYVDVTFDHDATLGLVIVRPPTPGPVPAVLILHGTHGFAAEYIAIAERFARAGYVAVAACWFAPGQGAGVKFITPVACPKQAPPIADAASPEAQARIAVLLEAVRKLPSVDPDRLVLMGHSRGAGAALNYVLNGGGVRGVILNSAGYPDAVVAKASAMRVPALIMHGARDNPADGGSEVTSADRAQAFVNAVEAAGRAVTVRFYPDGDHNSLFTNPAQMKSEVALAIEFIERATAP